MRSSTTTIVAVALSVFLCIPIGLAQAPTPAAPRAGSAVSPKVSPGELDKLVAPVVLYPDALVAHVLPASTAPVDVIEAARYLKQRGSKIDTTDDKAWHPSVKILVRFPEVLYKMEADLEWTIRLGQAVAIQLEDVMTAIQRVRNLAYTAGNLSTNEKQVVIVEREVIQVQPATSTIYVPSYNPDVIVVHQDTAAAATAVTFAAGVVVGAALADDDCDWHGYGIYHGHYYYGGDWDDYWRRTAQLPWNPRGVADPRGLYDPRGVFDPRGRYDPRGPLDPRGRYDPRGAFDPRGPYDPRGGYGAGVIASPYAAVGPRGVANPRGVADPRGVYDPRGVADPRGARDPRGAADPRTTAVAAQPQRATANRAATTSEPSASRGYGSTGNAKATSASPFTGTEGSSQIRSASDRGRQSQSGGSTPSASRSSGGRSGGSGMFSGGGGSRGGGRRR